MNATMTEARVATDHVRFQRTGVDRRAGDERRQVHDLSYFERGIERRRSEERRVSGEQRAGWVRVTQWGSICICDPVAL